MAGAAPVLRPLLTVLGDVGTFDRKLVLVRGKSYGHIDDVIKETRSVSASGPPEVRKELTESAFWADKDADKKIVIMHLAAHGPEVYMVEAGSRTPVFTESWPANPVEMGRARSGLTFEGRRFTPREIYSWDELPSETRQDLLKQADDIEFIHGRTPDKLQYRFQVMPHADLVAFLTAEYGKGLEKAMDSRAIASLARSIEREGLKYPPAVDEGWKRALALASLDMDMPFFGVVPPFISEEMLFSPAVEGNEGNHR